MCYILEPNEVFQIENSAGSGVITTKAALNREGTEQYTLLIQAKDRARVIDQKSATATVKAFKLFL